jgi:hypothetical protein
VVPAYTARFWPKIWVASFNRAQTVVALDVFLRPQLALDDTDDTGGQWVARLQRWTSSATIPVEKNDDDQDENEEPDRTNTPTNTKSPVQTAATAE